MTEAERSAVLDAVALVEAEVRGDELAESVILFADANPARLRRLILTLAYMLARVEDADDPKVLDVIRRTFAGRATSP